MIEISIPILNEEYTLTKQIEHLIGFINESCPELTDQIYIILADNGSIDTTSELSQALERKYSQVKYLKVEQKGVGRALKKSWDISQADIIGYMDLDFSTDLNHLPEVFSHLLNTQADVVTGSRLMRGSKVIGRSLLRTITSRGFNFLLRLLFKTKISDGMCGFKFLTKDAWNTIKLNGADDNGWFFATEVLLVAEFLKFKILSIPVCWTDEPNSKVKIINLSVEYIKRMLKLRRLFKQSKGRENVA